MSIKNWFKFFTLSLIWGTSFFWIKISLQEVGPITLVFFRAGFATLGLILFTWLARKGFPLKYCWVYLFLGFFNVALPFVLISWSEKHISSGLASVMNATEPLAIALFAAIFIKEERLTLLQIIGLLAGFGGVLVLYSNQMQSDLSSQGMGILAMAAAMLAYGGSAVFARVKNSGVTPENQSLGQMAFALIFVTPLMLSVETPFNMPALPITYFALAWLGLLGSFVGSLLWFSLIHEIGPSKAGMTTYLLPLVGVTLGALVLHEDVSWRLLVGGLLIILGIIMVNRKKPLEITTVTSEPI